MKRIRIATYNILDGAGDGRAVRQLDMLCELRPDLLILTEAMGEKWAPGGALRREFEARLQMWSAGRLETGDGDGAGRHSLMLGRRGRIHRGRYKPLGTRPRNWRGTGLQEVRVEGDPRTITVMGIHGHTLDPDTRLSEARHTARCSIDLAPGPAIMAGDFNSVHGGLAGRADLPVGDLEPDLSRLPAGMLAYHLLLDAFGDPVTDQSGHLICDRRPSKILQLAGFRDAIADRHPNPEDRPATGGLGPADVPRRLDRIYTRELPVVDSAMDGPEVTDLSDHLPVYADVDLDRPTAPAAMPPAGC